MCVINSSLLFWGIVYKTLQRRIVISFQYLLYLVQQIQERTGTWHFKYASRVNLVQFRRSEATFRFEDYDWGFPTSDTNENLQNSNLLDFMLTKNFYDIKC